MKSLGVCYWYVKMTQCRYVEHGLEYITFYVKKQTPLAVCSGPPLVRHKTLGAPTFVIFAYWGPLAMLTLTHWGWVTHICVGNITIIASDHGLSPGRRQAIIWTNAEMLLLGPLGTNFSEILIGIHTFSFKKMHEKMSAKWRPFCLGLNVLKDDMVVVGGEYHIFMGLLYDK